MTENFHFFPAKTIPFFCISLIILDSTLQVFWLQFILHVLHFLPSTNLLAIICHAFSTTLKSVFDSSNSDTAKFLLFRKNIQLLVVFYSLVIYLSSTETWSQNTKRLLLSVFWLFCCWLLGWLCKPYSGIIHWLKDFLVYTELCSANQSFLSYKTQKYKISIRISQTCVTGDCSKFRNFVRKVYNFHSISMQNQKVSLR